MAEGELSCAEALRIYEVLYQGAPVLGAISSGNIGDGFEMDLRIAKAINGLQS